MPLKNTNKVGKVLISPCRLSLKTTTNHGDAYARLFKL